MIFQQNTKFNLHNLKYILTTFCDILKNVTLSKTALATFWIIFAKHWARFYYKIWSH